MGKGMEALGRPYRALVIGSSGAIGAAFLELLRRDPDCEAAIGVHRRSDPSIDYDIEESIWTAAHALEAGGVFQLIINATGILHTDALMPEKKLDDLTYDRLSTLMRVNAIGPALTIRHFSRLLDPERSVMAVLSAKVGSIEDNRLGGWYGYRASKAALNMLLKTPAIELRRTRPNTVLVALHPGTVNSGLSKPFGGERIGRHALDAAGDMLTVMRGLEPPDTGSFFSYSGEKLPW